MRIVMLEVCVVIAALVFVVMLLSVARSRTSNTGAPHFHQRAAEELAWAAVPWVILIAGAVPAIKVIVASPITPQAVDATVRVQPMGTN